MKRVSFIELQSKVTADNDANGISVLTPSEAHFITTNFKLQKYTKSTNPSIFNTDMYGRWFKVNMGNDTKMYVNFTLMFRCLAINELENDVIVAENAFNAINKSLNRTAIEVVKTYGRENKSKGIYTLNISPDDEIYIHDGCSMGIYGDLKYYEKTNRLIAIERDIDNEDWYDEKLDFTTIDFVAKASILKSIINLYEK